MGLDAEMSKKVAFIALDARTFMLFRKDLAQTILKRGWEVHVLIPLDRCLSPLQDMGIVVHNIDGSNASISPLKDIRLFFRLLALLSKIKPDVSFCYSLKSILYGALASKLAGVGHICSLVTGIGYVFMSKTLRAKIIRCLIMPFYKLSLRCSHRILFQNVENMRFVSNSVKSVAFKCFVVDGSGVNMQVYKRLEPVSGERASFILTARLLKDKGVREYVEAANILKKTYAERFDAALVGGESSSPGSLSYADVAKINVNGGVDVLGECGQEELIGAYQRYNIFVLPSYYGEGIPRSILEAMSMKMAVITTDWPGCRETVNQGENGLLIAVRSVEELVQAMEKCIVNPGLIPQWGEKSLGMVRERFEINLINRQYLKYMNVGEVP